MTKVINDLVTKMADRLLPKTEAAAGCAYYCEIFRAGAGYMKCCDWPNCTSTCTSI